VEGDASCAIICEDGIVVDVKTKPRMPKMARAHRGTAKRAFILNSLKLNAAKPA
jgi:hypothetical protein